MENENKNQLQIELKEEVAQGTYANLAIITHSSSEFILDFVRVMPGLPKAGVQSRIVMTPEHAKRLMFALQDNVAKYEQNFGQIRMPEQQAQGGKTFVPPLSDFKGEALKNINSGLKRLISRFFRGMSFFLFKNSLSIKKLFVILQPEM